MCSKFQTCFRVSWWRHWTKLYNFLRREVSFYIYIFVHRSLLCCHGYHHENSKSRLWLRHSAFWIAIAKGLHFQREFFPVKYSIIVQAGFYIFPSDIEQEGKVFFRVILLLCSFQLYWFFIVSGAEIVTTDRPAVVELFNGERK